MRPRRLRPAPAQVSWGLVDQGFSSGTNFGLTVIAGRLAGPSGLGVVYIGFSIYLLALSFQRALITDPFVVASAPLQVKQRSAAARAALALVLTWGTTSAAVMALLSTVIPGSVGRGLIIFAPWIPLLLIQDYWRAVLFRDGRGAAAAANDGLWLVVMAAMVPFAWAVRTEWAIVSAWSMGAAAGAGLGVLQARIRPERLARAWTWWRQEGVRLGRWLGLENCLIAGQSQVLIIVLASLLGARDLGGLRAVESVFAPMTVVGEAIGMPGLPMLSRALADSWRAGRRVAVVLSSVTLATVSGYVLVAGLIRGPVLSTVFGPSFRHFANLVVPIAVGQVVYAWASGFWLLTKASGRGGVLLTARAVGSGGSLLLATVLGATFGLTGAAWGLTLGTGAGSSLITYFAFARRSVDVMPDPAEPAVVSDAALGAPTGLPDP